ncbi:MAG: hypothetical protein ACEQSR_03055 [Candidatus Methylacidiphilales bacterium]
MRSYLTILLLIITVNVFSQHLSSASFLAENNLPSGSLRLGKTNLFNQIYIEAGVKASSLSDSIGNLNYFQVGLQHQLTKKLSVFHAYNNLIQGVYWGTIEQQSYYANFEYKASKSVKLNIVGSYLYNKTKQFPVPFVSDLKYYTNHNYFALASATFNIKHFFYKPMLAFSQLNNLSEKNYQYQLGGDLFFDLKNNESYVFGLGMYHLNNNNNLSTIIKPYASFLVNDDLLISVDYLYASAKNFSDQDGYLIYNSVDKTIDRTSLTAKYEFLNNAFLFAIYQFERKQDYIFNFNYHFNSIFLGIKYNL